MLFTVLDACSDKPLHRASPLKISASPWKSLDIPSAGNPQHFACNSSACPVQSAEESTWILTSRWIRWCCTQWRMLESCWTDEFQAKSCLRVAFHSKNLPSDSSRDWQEGLITKTVLVPSNFVLILLELNTTSYYLEHFNVHWRICAHIALSVCNSLQLIVHKKGRPCEGQRDLDPLKAGLERETIIICKMMSFEVDKTCFAHLEGSWTWCHQASSCEQRELELASRCDWKFQFILSIRCLNRLAGS